MIICTSIIGVAAPFTIVVVLIIALLNSTFQEQKKSETLRARWQDVTAKQKQLQKQFEEEKSTLKKEIDGLTDKNSKLAKEVKQGWR